MKRKYSPLTASCLVRYNEMIRTRENEGYAFDLIEGQRVFAAHEVAYVCGITTTSVANFVKEGRLKCLKYPKSVLFTEEQLMQFIGASYETA